jgi:hypothetical protein
MNAIFWNVIPCILLEVQGHFGEKYFAYLQGERERVS